MAVVMKNVFGTRDSAERTVVGQAPRLPNQQSWQALRLAPKIFKQAERLP